LDLADPSRLIVVVLILIGRFVQVVVVSHHAGNHKDHDQEREKQNGSPRESPVVPHHIGRNRHNQSRGSHGKPQLPGPEHQVQMILAADLAPHREDRLQRNQEFDDQQRAEKSVRHGRKVSICEPSGFAARMTTRI
jgi:hypothetical protein